MLLANQLEGGEKNAPPHLKRSYLRMKLLPLVGVGVSDALALHWEPLQAMMRRLLSILRTVVLNAFHFQLKAFSEMVNLPLVVPVPNALHLETPLVMMRLMLLVGVVLKVMLHLEALLAMMRRLLLLVEVTVQSVAGLQIRQSSLKDEEGGV